jgi:hypothetical protein
MTTQGRIRLSYATDSIFVGWWRNAACHSLPYFCLPRATKNNFFLVDDKCSHRCSTRSPVSSVEIIGYSHQGRDSLRCSLGLCGRRTTCRKSSSSLIHPFPDSRFLSSSYIHSTHIPTKHSRTSNHQPTHPPPPTNPQKQPQTQKCPPSPAPSPSSPASWSQASQPPTPSAATTPTSAPLPSQPPISMPLARPLVLSLSCKYPSHAFRIVH